MQNSVFLSPLPLPFNNIFFRFVFMMLSSKSFWKTLCWSNTCEQQITLGVARSVTFEISVSALYTSLTISDGLLWRGTHFKSNITEPCFCSSVSAIADVGNRGVTAHLHIDSCKGHKIRIPRARFGSLFFHLETCHPGQRSICRPGVQQNKLPAKLPCRGYYAIRFTTLGEARNLQLHLVLTAGRLHTFFQGASGKKIRYQICICIFLITEEIRCHILLMVDIHFTLTFTQRRHTAFFNGSVREV